MQNHVQAGAQISVTAPYDRTSGQGTLVGSLFGVAVHDALSGEDIEIARCGVYTLTKATGAAWTQGAKLYWDNTNKNVTTTSTSNTFIGYAAAAAASGDTTGNVLLHGAST